jgi:hypothetical protein
MDGWMDVMEWMEWNGMEWNGWMDGWMDGYGMEWMDVDVEWMDVDVEWMDVDVEWMDVDVDVETRMERWRQWY